MSDSESENRIFYCLLQLKKRDAFKILSSNFIVDSDESWLRSLPEQETISYFNHETKKCEKAKLLYCSESEQRCKRRLEEAKREARTSTSANQVDYVTLPQLKIFMDEMRSNFRTLSNRLDDLDKRLTKTELHISSIQTHVIIKTPVSMENIISVKYGEHEEGYINSTSLTTAMKKTVKVDGLKDLLKEAFPETYFSLHPDLCNGKKRKHSEDEVEWNQLSEVPYYRTWTDLTKREESQILALIDLMSVSHASNGKLSCSGREARASKVDQFSPESFADFYNKMKASYEKVLTNQRYKRKRQYISLLLERSVKILGVLKKGRDPEILRQCIESKCGQIRSIYFKEIEAASEDLTRLVIFVAFEEKESVERAMIQFNHAELGPARDRVVAKRLQDKKDDRYEVAYLLNEMFKCSDESVDIIKEEPWTNDLTGAWYC